MATPAALGEELAGAPLGPFASVRELPKESSAAVKRIRGGALFIFFGIEPIRTR